MADHEKTIQELESQFPAMSGIAFDTASREALAAGLSVLYTDRGAIYEYFPDGTRRLVRKIEAPTPSHPGETIRIR